MFSKLLSYIPTEADALSFANMSSSSSGLQYAP